MYANMVQLYTAIKYLFISITLPYVIWVASC